MKPKITLLNWTPDPMETVYSLWMASKDEEALLSVQDVKDKVPREKVEDLFWKVLAQRIPIGEHLHFTFVMEGVSVSWREQAVRHRIGTKVGDKVGVDLIPDLASSSWWSQSMRIQDMGSFASKGMFRIPDTLKGKTLKVYRAGSHKDDHITAEAYYTAVMKDIQDAYNKLVEAGVPMEDARELIPLGAQHRISWDMNLQSLLHILGERGCWILQMGIWGPVITGMVEELATKVHPMFRRILAPPCIKDDKFTTCLYRLENARRLDGSDAHPPCPLHLVRDDVLAKVEPVQLKRAAGLKNGDINVPRREAMVERAEEYRKLWGKDPYGWDVAAAK